MQLTEQAFANFFKFYKNTAEQQAAVKELYQALTFSNSDLLLDSSNWIQFYRKTPAKPKQRVSQRQLADIMQVVITNLPLSLVDELNSALDIFGITQPENISYFLGQCGAESEGLQWPLELASGEAYEFRSDLGNNQKNDGMKFKGCGYLQCTGRANHQAFSDYLSKIGKGDPNIMLLGSKYSCDIYAWSMSAFWWKSNGMNEFCSRNMSISAVSTRVNGTTPANGLASRISYSNRAFKILVDI